MTSGERRKFACHITAALFVLVLPTALEAAPPSASLEDVVLLGQADFSDETIFTFLDYRDIGFELGPEALIRLREAGVSEEIIQYLLERTGQRPEPVVQTAEQPVAVSYYPLRYYAGYYGTGGDYYWGAATLPSLWWYDYYYSHYNSHYLGHGGYGVGHYGYGLAGHYAVGSFGGHYAGGSVGGHRSAAGHSRANAHSLGFGSATHTSLGSRSAGHANSAFRSTTGSSLGHSSAGFAGASHQSASHRSASHRSGGHRSGGHRGGGHGGSGHGGGGHGGGGHGGGHGR